MFSQSFNYEKWRQGLKVEGIIWKTVTSHTSLNQWKFSNVWKWIWWQGDCAVRPLSIRLFHIGDGRDEIILMIMTVVIQIVCLCVLLHILILLDTNKYTKRSLFVLCCICVCAMIACVIYIQLSLQTVIGDNNCSEPYNWHK